MKALLAAHVPHQEGLRDTGLSPYTWFCTVYRVVNGRTKTELLAATVCLGFGQHSRFMCRSLQIWRALGKVVEEVSLV